MVIPETWGETDLSGEVQINGARPQAGYTGDLISGIDAIGTFLIRPIAPLAGDLIPTGTPLGAHGVHEGDGVIEVDVEGMGVPRTIVRQAPAARVDLVTTDALAGGTG